MSKVPIIIDGDPGVDDSFAIALANSYPDFEIVALTAVEGNVPATLTRKNTLGLREVLDIDCAVGYGAELPLEKPYIRQAQGVHGESGVGTVIFPEAAREPDKRPAWDLIYEEAVRAKGELVLFAIGPLTNIVIALRKHPDLPKYLKRFCIMGGGTFGNVSKTAEFNIWIDPLAAKEVFDKLEVYMVGLNVTMDATLSGEDFEEMIASCSDNKKSQFIKELSVFSHKNSVENGMDNHTIHDAVAVGSVIDPSLITYEKYYVYVEDREEMENVGETVVDLRKNSGKEPNCWVGMKVNQPLFVKMMKDMCRYYAGK